jgi:hypothetical protein
MLEAGKNEQCHDDASKEVTTPVGVVVVHITLGFYPALLASTDVPMSRSPLSFAAPRHGKVAHPPTLPRRAAIELRSTTPPSHHQPHAATVRGEASVPHEGKPPPSPPRLCPMAPLAAGGRAQGEDRGPQRIWPPMLPRLSDTLVQFVFHERFLA